MRAAIVNHFEASFNLDARKLGDNFYLEIY